MRKEIPVIFRAMRKVSDRPAAVSSSKPFRVLIATVLSQRTRDENTAKVAKQLFKKFDSAQKLSAAKLSAIELLVKPAGFYKVKAKRIREISKQLLERFEGKLPSNLPELVSLPGVGRKTANCVLVYAFQKPAMPVDVHVHRISNRIGLVNTKTPAQTEFALMETVPKRNWLELNHLMVRYGQLICLPRKPKCHLCKIRALCNHFSTPKAGKQL